MAGKEKVSIKRSDQFQEVDEELSRAIADLDTTIERVSAIFEGDVDENTPEQPVELKEEQETPSANETAEEEETTPPANETAEEGAAATSPEPAAAEKKSQ